MADEFNPEKMRVQLNSVIEAAGVDMAAMGAAAVTVGRFRLCLSTDYAALRKERDASRESVDITHESMAALRKVLAEQVAALTEKNRQLDNVRLVLEKHVGLLLSDNELGQAHFELRSSVEAHLEDAGEGEVIASNERMRTALEVVPGDDTLTQILQRRINELVEQNDELVEQRDSAEESYATAVVTCNKRTRLLDQSSRDRAAAVRELTRAREACARLMHVLPGDPVILVSHSTGKRFCIIGRDFNPEFQWMRRVDVATEARWTAAPFRISIADVSLQYDVEEKEDDAA